jgi:drug/metabolite transporter (DMT)-like permease
MNNHLESGILLSLLSALLWGAGDFSGGIASRRANVYGVVLVAHVVGVILMLVLAFMTGEVLPSTGDLVWGAAAGIVGGIGLLAFYRALAIGQMGIAAPVAAVISAGLPVIFSIFTDGLPQFIQIAGFGIALVGMWLVSSSGGSANRPTGLGLAIIAGLGFGGFLILIHRASPQTVFWPLAAARSASVLLMALIVFAGKRGTLPSRKTLPIVITAGVFDVLANALFAAAAQTGRLDTASILSSLYPAPTVILAWLFLKERLNKLQLVGIAAILTAIVLIVV